MPALSAARGVTEGKVSFAAAADPEWSFAVHGVSFAVHGVSFAVSFAASLAAQPVKGE